MERQFANTDLALWPCTLEVGLSKVERCSGLLPETQRKTVRVSLSFLFDVSVGHPRSCHMEVVMFPCSNEDRPVQQSFGDVPIFCLGLYCMCTRPGLCMYAIEEAVLCTACSNNIGLETMWFSRVDWYPWRLPNRYGWYGRPMWECDSWLHQEACTFGLAQ